jgi:hypothetical protein
VRHKDKATSSEGIHAEIKPSWKNTFVFLSVRQLIVLQVATEQPESFYIGQTAKNRQDAKKHLVMWFIFSYS